MEGTELVVSQLYEWSSWGRLSNELQEICSKTEI